MRPKGKLGRCHPELKNEIGTWGFKGEESNSQDDKKSRCLVIRCLPCQPGRSFRRKLSLVIALPLNQAPYLNSLRQLREWLEALLESFGPWLSSAQNNLRAKAARLGESHSEPLQFKWHCRGWRGERLTNNLRTLFESVVTALLPDRPLVQEFNKWKGQWFEG